MCYCVYRDGAVRAARLIKEARYEALARCIGDLLGEWLMTREAFSPIHYDCVIPIPQHWMRRWMHRYNQAEVLAEGVARQIGRPVEPGWLQRMRWSRKQGLQTIEERRQNMVRVFGVRTETGVRGKRVLLVDDVMTSGATLQDATRALRAAGAIGVSAVVFARGVSARGAAGSRPAGPSAEKNLRDQNRLGGPTLDHRRERGPGGGSGSH
jgi:predicted amidophosphoribosyltransferase